MPSQPNRNDRWVDDATGGESGDPRGPGRRAAFISDAQTDDACFAHHGPRGAAAVAGRSVCLPRPLPPPPFCCLNHRGCGRHAFRLRCLSGAFNDCPGSLPRPAFPPDRPRSRRSAQERQGGPYRHRRWICATALIGPFLDVADLWMPTSLTGFWGHV